LDKVGMFVLTIISQPYGYTTDILQADGYVPREFGNHGEHGFYMR
jgi:hypothetical protein